MILLHAQGRWHAVEDGVGIAPGEAVTTVAEEDVTADETDFPILGGFPHGELCEDCLEALRVMETQRAEFDEVAECIADRRQT